MGVYPEDIARGQYVCLWALVALQFIWGFACLLWVGDVGGLLLLIFNWAWGGWNATRIYGLFDYMWHGRV